MITVLPVANDWGGNQFRSFSNRASHHKQGLKIQKREKMKKTGKCQGFESRYAAQKKDCF